MMRNYAAITIGPILDTLSIAGSPGTLWCASTMFSRLARDLCESILDEIPGAEIDAPAYEKGFEDRDGVGRFHDRIFFTCELEREALAERLRRLCEKAKKALAHHISDALGQQDEDSRQETEHYISGYIQLSWLIADKNSAEAKGRNSILNLSPYLDCMELSAQRLPDETKSPIIRLLSGTPEGNNVYIYRRMAGKVSACWLIPPEPEKGAFQLLKDGSVRDTRDIADPFAAKDGRKVHSYCAAVQSDGDNMGAFLAACPPEQVREYSKCCIEYAEEAAKAVGAYGGLTIYAGGDDLLFLAPVEGRDGKNLLTLCREISDGFERRFKKLGDALDSAKTPTLSFGVSVNYETSPLYEALEDARALLFDRAKTGAKNQLALSMHKHAGQSVFLMLPNSGSAEAPAAKLSALIEEGRKVETETSCYAMHSVIYQLELYRPLFLENRRSALNAQDLYDNLFDSEAHDMRREYINDIKKLGDAIAAFPSCRGSNENEGVTDEPVDVLTSMLRFAKLYTEGEAEE